MKLSEQEILIARTHWHGPSYEKLFEHIDALQAERDAEVGAVLESAIDSIDGGGDTCDEREVVNICVQNLKALRTPAQASALEADRARVRTELFKQFREFANTDEFPELVELCDRFEIELRAAVQPASDYGRSKSMDARLKAQGKPAEVEYGPGWNKPAVTKRDD